VVFFQCLLNAFAQHNMIRIVVGDLLCIVQISLIHNTGVNLGTLKSRDWTT